MYEIDIIQENERYTLDMGGVAVPMTFTNVNMESVKDIQADWSYSFDIPRTPNNEKVFGYAGEGCARLEKIRRKYSAVMRVDGIEIASDALLYVDSITPTSYKCQLVSGCSDIMELLEGINYEDADNNDTHKLPLWEAYTDEGMVKYLPYKGVLYREEDGVTLSENLHRSSEGGIQYYPYATPSVRLIGTDEVPGMLVKALGKIGYTLVTNTGKNVLENTYITLADRARATTTPLIYRSGVVYSEHFQFPQPWQEYSARVNAPVYPSNWMGKDARAEIIVRYQPFWGSSSNWQVVGSAFFNAGGYIRIAYSVGGERKTQEYTIDNWKGESMFEFRIDASTIDTALSLAVDITASAVVFNVGGQNYLGVSSTTDTATAHWELNYESADVEVAEQGDTILVEKSTGISNALDLLKMCAQLHAWMIRINRADKVVEAYTIDEYVRQTHWSIASDWSDKVQSIEEITARYGDYARRNTITFTPDIATGAESTSVFEIEDDMLEVEKEFLSFDLHASDSVGFPSVPQWKVSDDTREWLGDNRKSLVQLPATLIANQAEVIIDTYDSYIDVLQNAEVIKVKVWLSVRDIVTLDMSKPVYIKQRGAYYLINKIQSWAEGKICTAELLKI